jgi:RNA polymerase sigma factor (sigma-70 family)
MRYRIVRRDGRSLGTVTTNLVELGMRASDSRGDVHARFEQLLETYSGLLRSLITQHCPRNLGIQINDIEQEARLRLWRALGREKEFASPASYIYRIAVSATIDAVRRVIARREDQLRTAGEGDMAVHEEPVVVNDAEEAVERRELMEKISQALATLHDNRRRVVELHLQGLTLEDISALLGWTEAKVRNLVYRGLDDLREALRREGIEYP